MTEKIDNSKLVDDVYNAAFNEDSFNLARLLHEAGSCQWPNIISAVNAKANKYFPGSRLVPAVDLTHSPDSETLTVSKVQETSSPVGAFWTSGPNIELAKVSDKPCDQK